MAEFINKAPGARGVLMKDGSTVWVEAGETKEIDKRSIASVHTDLVEAEAEVKKAPAKD